MIKNNGSTTNQLSDLDFGQVLKDSHNKDLHAIDVNYINSLVPSSYKNIDIVYDNEGNIITMYYYGSGISAIFDLTIPTNILGTSEISTFSFAGQTPLMLAGQYITLQDSIGKVVPWFNLDSSNIEPVVSGASRYIEIPISNTDSSVDLATKCSTIINSDSEFITQSLFSFSIIQHVEVGNFTDSTIGDTTLFLSIQNGVDSCKGKLFYLSTYDDSSKYAFYFTIDGDGVAPSYTGLSLTEIPLLSSYSLGDITQKIVSIINQNQYLSAVKTEDTKLRITYRISGDTIGFIDVNSNIVSNFIQNGQDLKLVQELSFIYNLAGDIVNIRALL